MFKKPTPTHADEKIRHILAQILRQRTTAPPRLQSLPPFRAHFSGGLRHPWCHAPSRELRNIAFTPPHALCIRGTICGWRSQRPPCAVKCFGLCEVHSHDRGSRSASSLQCACPLYSSRARFFFGQSITSPRFVSPPPPTAQIWLPATSSFSQSLNRR
jgi:hypothetical protein